MNVKILRSKYAIEGVHETDARYLTATLAKMRQRLT
jgi:hypothetical protein